jgi:hypothetical protein
MVGRAVTRHHLNPLRIALAVILSVVGLWMVVIALAMLYLALFRRDAAQVGSDTR